MFKRLLTTRSLCMSAIIAALYAVLTLVLAPISYGNLQCRVSEAMTLLPLIMPASIPGLFIGCVIANLYTGSVLDIIFGSLATLLAAVGTYALRDRRVKGFPLLSVLCPVVANGVIVGTVLTVSYGLPLLLTMLEVAVGEVGAVIIGVIVLGALKKSGFDFKKLS